MSSSSVGSQASYDNLKTVAGQVEQWVHRSQMKQAEANLKAGRSSAEADVTSAVQSSAALRSAELQQHRELQKDSSVQQQRDRFQHKGLM